MKTSIYALLAMLLPSTAFAEGDAPPRFKHVPEFIAWADNKLAANDYDGLAAAHTDTRDARQTKIAFVKKLDADLGEAKLTKIFEGRGFPKDTDTFKLGGHAKELGHCHIDFVKNGESWQITKVWHCR